MLDVRDAADCWLRICLSRDDVVVFPANCYHRLSHADIATTVVYCEFSVSNGSASISDSFTLRYVEDGDALVPIKRHTFRELICELCAQFYDAGWVTGTGGSISMRYGNRIFMTPSGVQKERIQPDELFLLDIEGSILSVPPQKTAARYPKLSDCSPLFLHCYRLRNAGAALHSHDQSCVLVTALNPHSNEFRISHQEMIKGIAGFGYHDELVVPIIDNTAHENELADSLERAIIDYPQSFAVLVRDHGIYVWGDSWEQAKRHSECLHYLFNIAIQKHQLGLSATCGVLLMESESNGNGDEEHTRKRQRVGMNGAVAGVNVDGPTQSCAVCCKKRQTIASGGGVDASKYKYVVLDIEGTTTPITFVKDVLFPFARENVRSHVVSTWADEQTRSDIAALRGQAEADLQDSSFASSMPNVESLLSYTASSNLTDELADCIASYVCWNIAADRKISALKQLQGHIWAAGYASGDLKSIVYDDVPEFMSRMRRQGVRVCIYSSGSREAQKLLFKYSNHGDLRPLLSCYFDTKIGHKREACSYREIVLSLGVDSADEILFVTDIIEEAEAAVQAGLHSVLSVRPGNAELPSKHPFQAITSMQSL